MHINTVHEFRTYMYTRICLENNVYGKKKTIIQNRRRIVQTTFDNVTKVEHALGDVGMVRECKNVIYDNAVAHAMLKLTTKRHM